MAQQRTADQFFASSASSHGATHLKGAFHSGWRQHLGDFTDRPVAAARSG